MKIPQPTGSDIINIALDTIQKGKQALVFVNTRASAEKTAEDISKKVKEKNRVWSELSEKLGNAVSSPTKQCKRLAGCMKGGVVFHHAGLISKQRELIEDNFRTGEIRIICCTPTLAAGLDLPAFRTIIKDLKRFGSSGMQDIPVLEYLQMAGRAGRPGKEEFGEAICIASSEDMQEAIHEQYILGEPEEIYSKLAVEPVLRFYILSLVATKFAKTRTKLIEFFSKSFWAHQYKDMAKLESIINKMIKLLADYEFIEIIGEKSDFVTASEFSDDALRATPVGERVAQLYLDPFTADHIIQSLKNKESLPEFGVLQMISDTLEMRPQLRITTKEWEVIELAYNKKSDQLLCDEPNIFSGEYEDFMQTIKTALFFQEWIEEKGEDYLLEKYKIRPGEIRAKLDRANWLLYAGEELSKLLSLQHHMTPLSKIRFRLKYGVKEELLPLLKLKGVGRVRARSMFNSGVKSLSDLKKVDIGTLAYLVGKKIAVDIKDQVGIKIDPETIEDIREKKKGQTKLGSF